MAQELKKRVPEQVCIDGKTLCHVMCNGGPLLIVTAWSKANRIVLGSIGTASKGKEIPAINALLGLFILREGDVVTNDAIGCQKSIVTRIVDQKADYMIRVLPKLALSGKTLMKIYAQLE